MENEVAKALHDGLDILRERGWCKWRLCDEAGRMCARGAVLTAAGIEPHLLRMKDGGVMEAADRLLCGVAREQYPEWAGEEDIRAWMGDEAIAYINNHDDSTIEDIERIFEKAIVRAYETL